MEVRIPLCFVVSRTHYTPIYIGLSQVEIVNLVYYCMTCTKRQGQPWLIPYIHFCAEIPRREGMWLSAKPLNHTLYKDKKKKTSHTWRHTEQLKMFNYCQFWTFNPFRYTPRSDNFPFSLDLFLEVEYIGKVIRWDPINNSKVRLVSQAYYKYRTI